MRAGLDLENLRAVIQMLSLAGTAAWLAVGALCLHLWRRERKGWYGRLGAGFLLLGLNNPLATVLSWLLEPIYTYFSATTDPFGQGTGLIDSIASNGLALIAVVMISLGVAISARPVPPADGTGRRGARSGRGRT